MRQRSRDRHLALVIAGAPPLMNYVITPCRVDALATGAFIALLWLVSGAMIGRRYDGAVMQLRREPVGDTVQASK